MEGLSVIVPCFNEKDSLNGLLSEVLFELSKLPLPWEVIIVDDASTDGSLDNISVDGDKVRTVSSQFRRGYGASLKAGLRIAKYDLMAIIDADGTYPAEMMPVMVRQLVDNDVDMVVGARTKAGAKIPVIRRPAKWMINRLAEYLADRKIPDVNSGMRVMKKNIVERFLNILPDGFSFTTTITLAMMTNGYSVEYVPIDYYMRSGKSKFRAIQDTMKFIQLVLRTVMYFNPLKIFVPTSIFFFILSFLLLIYRMVMGRGFLVISILLFISAMQFLAIGALADLIDKRDALRQK
ncbi:MAG: glycosyltransferase family 2 protein [Candidatus Omnitrophota bacterium]